MMEAMGGKCRDCGRVDMSVEPVQFPVGRTGGLDSTKYKTVSLCSRCTDILFTYIEDCVAKYDDEKDVRLLL